MQGRHISCILLVLLLMILPAGASTTKIVGESPVFVGETNLDLTKALDNCRIIAWWPEGADMTQPPAKNITLRPLNEYSAVLSKYTFSPSDYFNYTGTWYCEEKKPYKAVFTVLKPDVKISVWDVDNDMDVTGTTIPATMNVTYRIDTNMDPALSLKYRPELTPADGFWSVKLTDPNGKNVQNIYTGNYGESGTVILTLDSTPYITSSPYVWNYWKNGAFWNLAARNAQGEQVYPSGTYRFTVSQNLNGMKSVYEAAGIDTDGILSSTADITFEKPVIDVTTTKAPVSQVTTAPAVTPGESMPVTTAAVTTGETEAPIPTGTVYQPLPAWIVLLALGIAGMAVCLKRQ